MANGFQPMNRERAVPGSISTADLLGLSASALRQQTVRTSLTLTAVVIDTFTLVVAWRWAGELIGPSCRSSTWTTAEPKAAFRSMIWAHEFELRNQRRMFSLEAGETFLRRAVGLEAANQKR